jgi:tetratricopeptide (TPR) repeat protein
MWGLPACSRTDDLESARALVAQATQEMARAQSLHEAGNAEGANDAALDAQESLRDARAKYLAARADQNRDVDVLIEFAEFSERMEDYDLAGEAYARAAETAESRPGLWYRAARNFIEARGRYLERVSDALAAVERANPGAAEPVSQADLAAARGDLFMALGLPIDAHARYAEALTLDANHVRARIGDASASLRLGDTARAAALAESFAAPSQGEAILLDRTLRAAYLDFRRDRMIVNETAEAHLGLAKLSVRLGFLEEARLAIERAVQLDESNVYAWNLLGSLARQAGDTERARAAFTRSLELQPDQPRTREALDALGAAD